MFHVYNLDIVDLLLLLIFSDVDPVALFELVCSFGQIHLEW